MKNKNKILLFVKNFMLGYVIYGLITPAINSEVSAYLYENLALSRELLHKTTINLIGGLAVILAHSDPKSKILDINRFTANLPTDKKPFVKTYPKRRISYPLFLFANCFFYQVPSAWDHKTNT